MLEGILLNYGILGAWTIWLLYEHNTTRKEMKTIIQNNTSALAEFKYIKNECKESIKYAK